MRKYLNKLIAFILLVTLSLIIFNYSNNESDEFENKLNEFNDNSSPGTNEI